MQELDDAALLREYVERDSEEAFAALVTRHINKVYSVALRHTGNPHQAEEITQAVFVILARKSRHLGKRVLLSGWLYQTARLTAVTFIRSEIRRARREQEAYMQTVLNESESDTWPRIVPLLDAAMARLNERDRHAVVMRFFDDKSMKDVGAALGGSEDAAKMRVNRAVGKLQRFFLRHGVTSTTEAIVAAVSANSVQIAPATLAKSVAAVALAKGAATGGSAVLVKATLKLMAWYNAKTALMTASAILLATGVTALSVKEVHAVRGGGDPDIAGVWETAISSTNLFPFDRFDLHTVLRISKTNGVYHAASDWVELGQSNFPVTTCTCKDGILRLRFNTWGDYTGAIDPAGTEIQGSFISRNGDRIEALWKRTAHPDVPPAPLAERDYASVGVSTLQGFWTGQADIKGIPMRMNLKISGAAPRNLRAELDYPDFGIRHVPATVTYDKPDVELGCLGAEVDGTMNDSNSAFHGVIPFGSVEIPWIFQRGHKEPIGDFLFTDQTDLQGHWRGTLNLKGIKIPLFLHIAELPDGKYSAAVDIPDGGLSGMLATAVQYRPPRFRVVWVWMGYSFDGKLDHGKLSGEWSGNGENGPVVFQRSSENE
jgi:RNA polymerase sigma factor (sigma-70 family)